MVFGHISFKIPEKGLHLRSFIYADSFQLGQNLSPCKHDTGFSKKRANCELPSNLLTVKAISKRWGLPPEKKWKPFSLFSQGYAVKMEIDFRNHQPKPKRIRSFALLDLTGFTSLPLENVL